MPIYIKIGKRIEKETARVDTDKRRAYRHIGRIFDKPEGRQLKGPGGRRCAERDNDLQQRLRAG